MTRTSGGPNGGGSQNPCNTPAGKNLGVCNGQGTGRAPDHAEGPQQGGSTPPSAPTLVKVNTSYNGDPLGIAQVVWTNYWSNGDVTSALYTYDDNSGTGHYSGNYVPGDNLPAGVP